MNNDLDKIRIVSHKNAIITIAGVAIVIVTIIYAYLNLDSIDKTAEKFSENSVALAEKLEETQIKLEESQEKLFSLQKQYVSKEIKRFKDQVCTDANNESLTSDVFIERNETKIRELVSTLFDLGFKGDGELQTEDDYKIFTDQLTIHMSPTDNCLNYLTDNTSIKNMLQRPPHNKCRHPKHEVERYKNSEIVSRNSGWVGGGRNQQWWCETMKRRFEANKQQDVIWKDQRSSEEVKKDWIGHVEYRYLCTATAQWGPIYKLKSSEYCN